MRRTTTTCTLPFFTTCTAPSRTTHCSRASAAQHWNKKNYKIAVPCVHPHTLLRLLMIVYIVVLGGGVFSTDSIVTSFSLDAQSAAGRTLFQQATLWTTTTTPPPHSASSSRLSTITTTNSFSTIGSSTTSASTTDRDTTIFPWLHHNHRQLQQDDDNINQADDQPQNKADDRNGGDDDYDDYYNFESSNMAWMSGYSLKFQGCHGIKQWNTDNNYNNNNNNNNKDDVRIKTKRLVRFRLCPSDSCSASKAAGCTSAYGDYVVDLEAFVQAYMTGLRSQQDFDCQYHVLKNCDCNNDDGGGNENGNNNKEEDGENDDYFNNYGNAANAQSVEDCQYDCFVNAGLYMCVDQYEYNNNNVNNQFQIENYWQCNVLMENPNYNNNQQQNDGQGSYYYVGPYCAGQGGSVKLGVFTDDTCTEFVDNGPQVFQNLLGFDLPYSTDDATLIDSHCLSCLEQNDAQAAYEAYLASLKNYYKNNNNNNNNNNINQDDQQYGMDDANAAVAADDVNNANHVDDFGNDADDTDTINEMCETLYSLSGKCEANYPSGQLRRVNNNACTYMEGIRIVRNDGIIDTGSTRPSAVATAFIVVFAMAFCAMAFYVWYLRTRLGDIKRLTKHALLS